MIYVKRKKILERIIVDKTKKDEKIYSSSPTYLESETQKKKKTKKNGNTFSCHVMFCLKNRTSSKTQKKKQSLDNK